MIAMLGAIAQRSGLVQRAAIGFAIVLGGCAGTPPVVPAQSAPAPHATSAAADLAAAEATYGIKVQGLRLSAAGSMLDFRYRVIDAKRAAPLLDGKTKPYLLDEARGATLDVPDTPVLGRIRQTARNNNVMTDRNYFIMFGNPGKALRSGDKVTLLLGQVRITDLMVQ